VAFADGGEGEVVEGVVVAGKVYVGGRGPMGLGDEVVLCASGGYVACRCLRRLTVSEETGRSDEQ
jgi:hypothetical protein